MLENILKVLNSGDNWKSLATKFEKHLILKNQNIVLQYVLFFVGNFKIVRREFCPFIEDSPQPSLNCPTKKKHT
jgi:hypothetical protein